MEKMILLFLLVFEICVSSNERTSDVSEFRFGDSGLDVRRLRGVNNNRRKLRKPKFVDVYTNHPNIKDVEVNFYKLHPRNKYQAKNHSLHHHISSEIKPKFVTRRKDTLNFPNIENLFSSSKNDFLESDYGDFESPKYSEEYFSTETKFDYKNPNRFEGDLDTYNDRDKYVYPKFPPFYTQTHKNKPPAHDDTQIHGENEGNLVFLQSQVVIPDSENYGSYYMPAKLHSDSNFDPNKRPDFWTKRQNFSFESDLTPLGSDDMEIVTRPYSFIQKIPLVKRRPPTTIVSSEIVEASSNRYEEVDLSQGTIKPDAKPKNIMNQINDIAKKYLLNLLIEKYGLRKLPEHGLKKNKTSFQIIRNGRKFSSVQDIVPSEQNSTIDQETKFLNSNPLWDLKKKTLAKIKQFFSLFTVIKFNQTECNAANWVGTWQGVCLTSLECTQWNGIALGNCASGYGVCCVFRGSCGDSSSMNCSYFKSPNYPDYYPSNGGVITPTTTLAPTTAPTPDPRLHWYYYNKGWENEALDDLIMGRQSISNTMSCVFSVYKTNPNVQQFRIDFIDLDLAGPTNGTCTNERLIITGQNANDQIPVICGYNTGQHVYVDVSQLNGPLRIMVLSATGARKRFKLRICQYTDSCGTSQSNCLQYYTGTSGVIQSFNYDQPAMFNRSRPGYFNNLNYAICIRREAGYCSITYTNVGNGQTYPFQLVNILPNGQSTVPTGQAGVDVLNCPDDYIIIDGTRLCGDRFNDGSTVANFSLNAPVVDTSTGPIVINVRTNNNVTGLGFKLFYMQNRCTTT